MSLLAILLSATAGGQAQESDHGPSWVLTSEPSEVIGRVRAQEAWFWALDAATVRYESRTQNSDEAIAREDARLRQAISGIDLDDPQVRSLRPELSPEVRESVTFAWSPDALMLRDTRRGIQDRTAVHRNGVTIIRDNREVLSQSLYTRDPDYRSTIALRLLAPVGIGRICDTTVWWTPWPEGETTPIPPPDYFIDLGRRERGEGEAYRVLLQTTPSIMEWWVSARTGRLEFLRGMILPPPTPELAQKVDGAILLETLTEFLPESVAADSRPKVAAQLEADPAWPESLARELETRMQATPPDENASADAVYIGALFATLQAKGLLGGDITSHLSAAEGKLASRQAVFDRIKVRASIATSGFDLYPGFEFSFGDWRRVDGGGEFPHRMGFVSWTLGGEDERQRLTTRVVTVSEVVAGEAARSLFELAIPVGAPLVDRTVDPPRLGTYQGE